MKRWIKFHKELIEETVWVTGTLEQRNILIILLYMANHKPVELEFNGNIIEVKAGQIVTSLHQIVKMCNHKKITEAKVRKALEKFVQLKFITCESTNQNRLISFCNWNKYKKGWIKLYTELINKPIWVNSTLEQRIIFVTLLCMANYKPNKWEFNGDEFEIKEGQFITSLPKIVEKCNHKSITLAKVRTALDRFVQLGFITYKSTNKNRLISIVNWKRYQCYNEEKAQNLKGEMTNSKSLETSENIRFSKNRNIIVHRRNNRHIAAKSQTNDSHIAANNKNNTNNRILNNQSIYQSKAIDGQTDDVIENQLDMFSVEFNAEQLKQQIRENISYDLYMTAKDKERDKKYVDEIYKIMCDIVCVPRRSVKINGTDYPYETVKSVFLKLNYSNIEYVRERMDKNTTKIENIRAYLITALFNSYMTPAHYYENAVNYDFYGGGAGGV